MKKERTDSIDSIDELINSIEVLDYTIIPRNIYDFVYKPNDDTFLLFEGIKQDIYKIMEIDP
jgi:hypothetical protein